MSNATRNRSVASFPYIVGRSDMKQASSRKLLSSQSLTFCQIALCSCLSQAAVEDVRAHRLLQLTGFAS
jgi:hypothetical protein